MVKIGIGELRNHASRYVRRAAQGEAILILNRRRTVALLGPAPPEAGRGDKLLGCLRGTARLKGDLVRTTIPFGMWFRT